MEGTTSATTAGTTATEATQGSGQGAPAANTVPTAGQPGRDAKTGKFSPSTQAIGSQAKAGAKEATGEGKGSEAEAEGHEEIRLGGKAYKLPKDVAKAVKDYERGVQKKFQSVSQEQKQYAQQLEARFEQAFKQNPRAMFERYGMDAREFSEMTLAEQIELMQMSPEQKELRELRAERERNQMTAKQQQEADARAAEQAKENDMRQAMDTEFAEAWKESGLPADTYYVRQIAAVVADSMRLVQRGDMRRPLTAKAAASIVKERFESHVSGISSKLPPEALYKLIGPENFNRLREWDVARVTGSQAPASQKRPADQAASGSTRKSPLVFHNEHEWREHMDKLARE